MIFGSQQNKNSETNGNKNRHNRLQKSWTVTHQISFKSYKLRHRVSTQVKLWVSAIFFLFAFIYSMGSCAAHIAHAAQLAPKWHTFNRDHYAPATLLVRCALLPAYLSLTPLTWSIFFCIFRCVIVFPHTFSPFMCSALLRYTSFARVEFVSCQFIHVTIAVDASRDHAWRAFWGSRRCVNPHWEFSHELPLFLLQCGFPGRHKIKFSRK